MSLRSRRKLAVVVTVLAIGVFYLINRLEMSRLGNASFFTGVTTLTCVVLLILLGVRRRIPFLSLGRMSTWTQIHLYLGFFTFAIYALHVPTLIAGGPFEAFLSILFLIVSGSGVYGIYASRTLPKKLTSVEGQFRFDRMRWHRDQIAGTASDVIAEVAASPACRVLENFYNETLGPFFASSPSIAYVLAPSGGRRRQLLGELKELDRYLESESRSAAGKFAALVRRKDDLDYQFALQLRLRCWLVVHGTLSLLLLGGGILHAVIALRFMG